MNSIIISGIFHNKMFSDNFDCADADLKYHVECYIGDQIACCSKCGGQFITTSALTNHLGIQMDEDPLKCNYCRDSFRCRSDLSVLVDKHSGNASFVCVDCCEKLSIRTLLDTRIYEDRFQCSECRNLFANRSDLNLRIDENAGIVSFICIECCDELPRETQMNVHKNEYRFQCNKCHDLLANGSDLHVQIDENARNVSFICINCCDELPLATLLNVRKYNNPFRCNRCDNTFSNISDLNVHVNENTGKVSFICLECYEELQCRSCFNTLVRTGVDVKHSNSKHKQDRLLRRGNDGMGRKKINFLRKKSVSNKIESVLLDYAVNCNANDGENFETCSLGLHNNADMKDYMSIGCISISAGQPWNNGQITSKAVTGEPDIEIEGRHSLKFNKKNNKRRRHTETVPTGKVMAECEYLMSKRHETSDQEMRESDDGSIGDSTAMLECDSGRPICIDRSDSVVVDEDGVDSNLIGTDSLRVVYESNHSNRIVDGDSSERESIGGGSLVSEAYNNFENPKDCSDVKCDDLILDICIDVESSKRIVKEGEGDSVENEPEEDGVDSESCIDEDDWHLKQDADVLSDYLISNPVIDDDDLKLPMIENDCQNTINSDCQNTIDDDCQNTITDDCQNTVNDGEWFEGHTVRECSDHIGEKLCIGGQCDETFKLNSDAEEAISQKKIRKKSKRREEDQKRIPIQQNSKLKNEELFVCGRCGKSFKLETDLEEHIESLYTCRSGEKTWGKRRRKIVKYFECTFCKEKLREKRQFIKHLKKHRSSNKPDLQCQEQDGEKLFTCIRCGKEFLLDEHLISHYIAHIDNETTWDMHSRDLSNVEETASVDLTSSHEPNEEGLMKDSSSHQSLGSECDLVPNVETCNDVSPLIITDDEVHDINQSKRSSDRTRKSCLPQKTICWDCGLVMHMRGSNMERHIKTNHPDVHWKIRAQTQPVYCYACQRLFKTVSALEDHVPVHERSDPYACFKCKCTKFYSNIHSLDQHMTNFHPGKHFWCCSYCKLQFRCSSTLSDHTKTHSRLFGCTECRKNFPNRSKLKHHLLMHTQAVFICFECNKRFATSDDLDVHMKTHDESNVRPIRKSLAYLTKGFYFPCPRCKSHFKTRDSLHVHILNHSVEKPFVCATCGKRFFSKNNLNHHVDKQHTPTLECLECARMFVYKRGLVVHWEREHFSVQPRFCKDCNQMFIEKKEFDYHMRIHSEDVFKSLRSRWSETRKSYSGKIRKLPPDGHECIFCDRSYSTEDGMKLHMRRQHFKGFPFVCAVCKRSFTKRHGLLVHNRTFHGGEISLTCTQCGDDFTDKEVFDMHVQSHDGNKVSSNKSNEHLNGAAFDGDPPYQRHGRFDTRWS